jgi:uncharacterized protein
MYFITGMGEELGWSGYAIEPMQTRWGALRASLLLGVVWAIWHSIAFVQTQYPAGWIVWQCIKTVAMRMILVWIYNKTGKSVLAANLYHTTDNVSWSLFPNYGSYYDPVVIGLINSMIAVIIIFETRSNILTRYRQVRTNRIWSFSERIFFIEKFTPRYNPQYNFWLFPFAQAFDKL